LAVFSTSDLGVVGVVKYVVRFNVAIFSNFRSMWPWRTRDQPVEFEHLNIPLNIKGTKHCISSNSQETYLLKIVEGKKVA